MEINLTRIPKTKEDIREVLCWQLALLAEYSRIGSTDPNVVECAEQMIAITVAIAKLDEA